MRPQPRARAGAKKSALAIDVLVQSKRWGAEPRAARIVRGAIEAAAAKVRARSGEVSVVLTNDAAIRVLNRDWRRIDKPTNVLSFPAGENSAPESSAKMLGDIVIAYETLKRECRDEDKKLPHHLAHLAVHGFLHLMGYDHENDSQAEAMERLESDILAQLGVPDPYRARDLRRA